MSPQVNDLRTHSLWYGCVFAEAQSGNKRSSGNSKELRKPKGSGTEKELRKQRSSGNSKELRK